MKNIYKIITFILVFATLTMPASAYKSKLSYDEFFGNGSTENTNKDVWIYDDFTDGSIGEAPQGYYYYTGPGNTVVSEEKDTGHGIKNTMVFTKQSRSMTSANKYINPKKAIKAEVRFRIEKPEEKFSLPSFALTLSDNKKVLTEIFSSSGGGEIQSAVDEVRKLLIPTATLRVQPDIWYTYGVHLDLESKNYSFYIKTDALKNKKIANTTNVKYNPEKGEVIFKNTNYKNKNNAEFIDKVAFYTSNSGNGTLYIDYFSIDDTPVGFDMIGAKAEPIVPPYVITPGLYQGKDNDLKVKVNDNIIYFPENVIIKDNKYFAEYRKLFQSLGYQAFYMSDTDSVIAYGKKGIVNIKDNVISIGSEKINITAPYAYKNIIAVPIEDIAKALGYSVEKKGNTIVIKNEEVK